MADNEHHLVQTTWLLYSVFDSEDQNAVNEAVTEAPQLRSVATIRVLAAVGTELVERKTADRTNTAVIEIVVGRLHLLLGTSLNVSNTRNQLALGVEPIPLVRSPEKPILPSRDGRVPGDLALIERGLQFPWKKGGRRGRHKHRS